MPTSRWMILAWTLCAILSPCANALQQRSATGFSVLPASVQSQISAALAIDTSQHNPQKTDAGLVPRNQSQELKTQFSMGAVEVRKGSAAWRMSLRGYGYGDKIRAARVSAPRTDHNRVEYKRGPLTEWYVNGPVGLEQGFTIDEAPGEAGGQPLTIALALRGGLLAAADTASGDLILTGPGGKAQLRYSRLSARDANGRELPTWAEMQGKRLLLRVDDAGATYPVVIETWVQMAELTASDGAPFDEFGWSVAISGNTVVVGVPARTVGSNLDEGAAYVFVQPAGGWADTTQVAKLTASDGAANSGFGTSVSISGSGNEIVVGAPGATVGGNPYQGAAYVFVEPTGGWKDMNETGKLKASNGAVDDTFGASVVIDGQTIVVGAPYVSIGSNFEQGAAYVFAEPGSGWHNMTQTAELNALDGSAGDIFGVSVSISSGAIVVGASGAAVGGDFNAGKAYVFVKPSSGGWTNMTQTAELTASDAAVDGYFGESVGISGNTVVVGAPSDFAGAAYVFVEPTGGWTDMTQTAELTNSTGPSLALLGSSVSISHSTVVAGAPAAPVNSIANQGMVFVFAKPVGGWTDMTQNARFGALDGAAGDQLGRSVSIRGNIVAGAPFHMVGSNPAQGAAYVFALKNPRPKLISIAPSSATAGGPGFTLTVNGSDFVPASVVNWNGSPRSTTYVSKTELQAAILASDIAIVQKCKVTVTSPLPGGGTSVSQTFNVDNPVPVISSRSPSSTVAGGVALTLTVHGSNLISGSKVQWNGTHLTTTFVNSGTLTAIVTSGQIKLAGAAQITVFNPTPGGGTSNAKTFTIKNPVPTLTTLSPSHTTAGGKAFTLTLNGTNFVPTSQVTWNGSARKTTYVKKTQVQAAISASDIAAAGTAKLRVINPAPGGGTSNSVSFSIKP
ncbi:MAG: hypothetical protein WB952_20680 [Terriglobales bacterium]